MKNLLKIKDFLRRDKEKLILLTTNSNETQKIY